MNHPLTIWFDDDAGAWRVKDANDTNVAGPFRLYEEAFAWKRKQEELLRTGDE